MKNLTVEDARGRMLAGVAPQAFETIALDVQAIGRVLADPIRAVRDQPPFDASAMDGWAVRRADAEAGGVALSIVGESAAGRGYDRPLQPGQAVRIFTGAPVPDGADVVAIQEEAAREGEQVRLGPLAGKPSHIRPRGGDFRADQVLIEAGVRLDPLRLSLAAAAGLAQARVAARPRVAILSTGEELVSAGAEPGPFQIFDSGSPALSALAFRRGAAVQRLSPAGDNLDAIAEALRAVEAELIVTIGGASVGDHDLIKPALERLGLQIEVGSVAVRPGKPTWFGRLADGRRVLGLPGNPASALACSELFLVPLLAAWQGADPEPVMLRARLASPCGPSGPREHWMRAKLEGAEDGTLLVRPFPDQDSSLVTVFAASDCLVRRAGGSGPAAAGEVVDVLRLDRL